MLLLPGGGCSDPVSTHLSSWGMPLWMAMAGKFCSTNSWASATHLCTDFTKITTWEQHTQSDIQYWHTLLSSYSIVFRENLFRHVCHSSITFCISYLE